jgi:hypothetical protein
MVAMSFRKIGLPFVTIATMAMLAGCGGTSTLTGPLTADTAAPPAPANVTLSHDAQGRPAIMWDLSASSSVTGYEVYMYSPSPERASAYVLLDDPNPADNEFVLPDGADATVYRVMAVTQSGTRSAMSAPVTVVANPSGGGGIGAISIE